MRIYIIVQTHDYIDLILKKQVNYVQIKLIELISQMDKYICLIEL